MLVVNWMSSRLVSVEPGESMPRAMKIMEEHRVSRLPVISGGKLVGIVTDRDLKAAGPSGATSLDVHELNYLLGKVKVSDIMTPDPITIGQYETIEEAALLMLENKISGLPVVDHKGRPLAVLSQSDVFRALISLTGVTRGGVQFALDLPDAPGSIKRVADIIRKYGGRMVSILTSYDRVGEGRRKVYIRMKGLDRKLLMDIKEELATVGVLLYVVDNREHKTELLALGRYTRNQPPKVAGVGEKW